MLRSADIFVDRAHFIDEFPVERRFVVPIVRITELIPGRIDKGIHGVGVAPAGSSAERAGRIHERFVLGERRLSVRAEFDVVRQKNGEFPVRDRNDAALLAVNHRNWCAPVSLAGYKPVTQAVVDRQLTHIIFGKRSNDRMDGGFEIEAVKRSGIDEDTLLNKGLGSSASGADAMTQ